MTPEQTSPINPASAATPPLTPASLPQSQPQQPAPVMSAPTLQPVSAPAPEPAQSMPPQAPTIDPSLLQEAINDVPEEATAPQAGPQAMTLESINTAQSSPASTPQEMPPVETADASPFASAAPTANFSSANTYETPTSEPVQPPSVAFNDPAAAPDKPKTGLQAPIKIDFKKINPVYLIVGGGAFIIIALILILAFAIK